ncbi:MAG: hypothetical protein P8Z75_15005, partial [Gammaproteobacteria bacterium]
CGQGGVRHAGVWSEVELGFQYDPICHCSAELAAYVPQGARPDWNLSIKLGQIELSYIFT